MARPRRLVIGVQERQRRVKNIKHRRTSTALKVRSLVKSGGLKLGRARDRKM